jgi:pyruvate,orthophosphate dikinase
MDGKPVTIRLLDPPLHEFLPQADDATACGACGSALGRLCDQLAPELGVEPGVVQTKLEALHETNPMLGLRGCRLGVLYPDITRMQVRAIIEAAINITNEGCSVHPHIMIPLVALEDELLNQVAVVKDTAADVMKALNKEVPYKVRQQRSRRRTECAAHPCTPVCFGPVLFACTV